MSGSLQEPAGTNSLAAATLPDVTPQSKVSDRSKPRWRERVSPSLVVGASIIILFVVAAVVGPLFTPSPDTPDLGRIMVPPGSPGHLLGTDPLGRDLLSRILYGARISLIIAGLGMLCALAIGVSAGLVAAFGGRSGEVLVSRLVDIQLAFPYVLLAIAISSVLAPSVGTLILLMALAGWAAFARVVRATALQEASKDYVRAAVLANASRVRIARRYVLPNLLPSILVMAALQMAAMIVFEATLSYLGLGIQPPRPSLGGIILEGQNYLDEAWWIATVPGVAIVVLTTGLLLFADGLQTLLRRGVRNG
jgi:peptide/nickel transport system permease protein